MHGNEGRDLNPQEEQFSDRVAAALWGSGRPHPYTALIRNLKLPKRVFHGYEKRATRFSGTWIAAPFCGLRPVRAARTLVANVPNPTKLTSSPLERAAAMMPESASKICSKTAWAATLVEPVRAASSAMNSLAAALPMPEHPGPLSEREHAIAVYAQHEALAVVVQLLEDFKAGIARRHGVGDDR